MLWRDNQEKDSTFDGEKNKIEELKNARKSVKPEDLSDQSETVQKAFEGVQTLRQTLDQLRQRSESISGAEKNAIENVIRESDRKASELEAKSEAKARPDEAAIAAAERAIRERANEDELKQKEEIISREREERDRQLQKERDEAKKRIAFKKQQAQRMKQEQLEAEKIAALEASRAQKRVEALNKKNEASQKKLAAQKQRIERQKLIEQERAIQKKKREEAIAEIRRIKREQDEKKREERHAKAKKLKEERSHKSELRRQKKLAKKSAEMGGGIVNVHGTTVSTEIMPVAAFSIKDLLGFASRKEKRQAASQEEMQALMAEKERKREEAREVAARLSKLRQTKFQGSSFGRRYASFRRFCDEKKRPLFIGFAVLLTVAVGTAGVFNFLTAYEYSYNGKTLGYVKDKNDVIHITEMVQNALTEDKNLNVVIDARDDIQFKRVSDFHRSLTIDGSNDVLRRLTYMGDLNVKAYGIYIDGKKAGTVENKEVAAEVLQDIKDRYSSKKKGAEIEEAVIVEDIQVRRINADLQDINSEEQVVEKLCTSGEKETVHTVVVGETLADIARDYGTTEKELQKDNEGIDPKKLVVGSSIVIRQNAPIMTVKITEVRTYDKTIKYKTEKKDDKEMYKGYSEVDQEGKNGESQLTDRTVSINGEVIDTKNLKTEVTREPVTKIVRVGTKKRPPTVGSGKFIWPANPGTYTVTSEFKWRWGRQHQGIDLGCSVGTDVLAADGGTVTYAGYMGGYGNLVIIDHQNGMETYYGHNSSLLVSTGDKVYKGQHIAEAGSTGRSTGPHIHFGIMVNGTFENPRNYLP